VELLAHPLHPTLLFEKNANGKLREVATLVDGVWEYRVDEEVE